jgi:phosphatidylserine/phosphatidylglycerophosphate/cardiolipin synthase-like enzyme
MRAKANDQSLTVKAVVGTYDAILAFDLAEGARDGCLGFSIERTDLDGGNKRRWLPNMLTFKSDAGTGSPTTARAPLQSFRWGDYTLKPGQRYRYRVVPRYGSAADILAAAADAGGNADAIPGGVTIEVQAEDPQQPESAVFFNRGAAASQAYVDKFGQADPGGNQAALDWLSRGAKEAILGFLAAAGPGDALHAVIYEFQKEELLQGLVDAKARGVEVKAVYHARQKGAPQHAADHQERKSVAAAAGGTDKTAPAGAADDDDEDGGSSDHTRDKNVAAIKAVGLDTALGADLHPRAANPQGAIMHDKYVVRLRSGVPEAVLTGSTNWTDGALYGQLNVVHIVTDPKVAATYEQSFELLAGDPDAKTSKAHNAVLTPVPKSVDDIPPGVTPVFSPQSNVDMIELYAKICQRAKLLFVSAPFLLHQDIRDVLTSPSDGALRYVMGDKEGSFGKKGAIDIMNGDPGRVGIAATVLKNPLNDFQGKLLEGKESYHHAGVHIHSKIILADPFGDDPILVGGSANFSNGSTTVNDSNSLIVRGQTAISDIYATEFMRMFQHYWFRYREDKHQEAGTALGLDETDGWLKPFFQDGSTACRDRVAFVS